MQTRTIKVEYSRPRGYDVGYRAENNFTLLALPVPAELEGADSYRVYFESTVGEYLQTEPLTPTDGYVTVKITSDIVPEPGNMAAQLVAFADGEIVGYAPMITGSAKVSIPDGTERLSHSLAAEIALNTAARHSHANKAVLDKFAESDGQPTYDGKAIGGGGASTAEDISYTLSEDVKTDFPNIELESDTVKSGLDVAMYYAIAGMLAKYIQCDMQGGGGTVSVALQQLLDGFVFPAMAKAHEHTNKSTLDLISAVDGNLTYNGKATGGAWYVDVTQSDNTVTANKTAAEIYAAYEAGCDIYARAPGIQGGTMLVGLKSVFKSESRTVLGFSTSGAQDKSDVLYPIIICNNDAWSMQWLDLREDLLKADQISYGVNSNVNAVLNSLGDKSHSHDNKEILDLLSAANGKLQYNGSDVGLKGDKGDAPVKGTDYWTAADKAEIVNDTLAALPTWTGGNY